MRLLAVRHGQASAGSDDYDQLSEAGYEQARRLGRWLREHGVRPRRVLVGTMLRHQQTLDSLSEAFDSALPAAESFKGLNEFDHAAILAGFCRRHAGHPASVLGPAPWQAEPRHVAALIHAALLAWSDGSLDNESDVEPWSAFRQRVGAVMQLLTSSASGGDVLLVSSGGVLTQLALTALEAPDHRAADLNLGIRNSALCEFVWRDGQLRMLSWNSLPHLADAPRLWTHY